jgi:hypothetical protein
MKSIGELVFVGPNGPLKLSAGRALLARSSIATHSGNGIALEGLEDLLNTSRHSFRGPFVKSTLQLSCLDAVLVEVLEALVGVPDVIMRLRSSPRREDDLLEDLAPFSRIVAITIHDSIEHHAADIVREHRGERRTWRITKSDFCRVNTGNRLTDDSTVRDAIGSEFVKSMGFGDGEQVTSDQGRTDVVRHIVDPLLGNLSERSETSIGTSYRVWGGPKKRIVLDVDGKRGQLA